VGLKEPEFDFDLVTEPRQVIRVLCFSFGFGVRKVAFGKEIDPKALD